MILRTVIFTFLSILIFSSPVIADSDTEADKAAVSEFMKSEVVKKFHNDAYGYAVFPNIGKGGLGIGGAYGKGRVYRGGNKTGDVSMAQVSIGFQAVSYTHLTLPTNTNACLARGGG